MALSRGLLRLLAVTCCVTIANVYYAQPLLNTIARDLGVSQSAAGIVVAATQLGFAVGLVLVVPLGDIVPRRPLTAALLAIDAAALMVSAAAPGLRVLAAVAVLVGLTSVVVHMIIPYAATLARDRERAGVIGTRMGAVLVGVLLSQAFAGMVAFAGGWRAVYAVAAGLMAVMAVVVGRALPAHEREVGQEDYAAQMRAVLRLALSEPAAWTWPTGPATPISPSPLTTWTCPRRWYRTPRPGSGRLFSGRTATKTAARHHGR